MRTQDRIIMANSERPLTPKQAWRRFEEGISSFYTIEEAYEWLRRNPAVARKMTGAGLLECFEEDLKAKKTR